MSREGVTLTIYCDNISCTEDINLPLCPLADGGWDARNINRQLERAGWGSSEDYEDLCPYCMDIIFPKCEECFLTEKEHENNVLGHEFDV